jgi:hypothetical protein
MSRPRVELATLIELEVDEVGSLDYNDARLATTHIDAANGRAMVVVRGVLRVADVEATQVIGAALYDAAEITVYARGPWAVEFADAIAEAAEQERQFRRPGRQGAA